METFIKDSITKNYPDHKRVFSFRVLIVMREFGPVLTDCYYIGLLEKKLIVGEEQKII